MPLKRIICTTLLSGFGAAMGMQVFVWRMPWLIQEWGGVYFSQSASYAASGAIGGVLASELLLALVPVANIAKQTTDAGCHQTESILHGLTAAEEAVLLQVLQRLEKGADHE